MTVQTVGPGAVAVQIVGDGNSVTIFAEGSKLVLDQPHKRRGTGAPANQRQLLLTEWRATTLVGRDDELASVADWRASPATVAVRCITGRAGSGKTRLAIEACDRAEAGGWVAGFVSGEELRRFHAAQNLAQWRSPSDTLVVVDDAATSAGILKEWLTALARRPRQPEEPKLRILLLERHAEADAEDGWWAEFKRHDSLAQVGAGDLIGDERPVPLPAIAGVNERRALFAEAMVLAAGFLDRLVAAPPTAGADPDFDRRLADNRLENEPLFLLMAGIVAAERGAPTALALNRIGLADEMASLERQRLVRFGASRGLPADGDLIAHLAACVTLQGGCALAAARSLANEEVAAMGFPSPFPPDRLADLLAEALPAPGAAVDGVRPDLIGEAFLMREIRGPKARSEGQRLAIVERARQRDEANVLQTLVRSAQDLAEGSADYPAVRWLAELANRSAEVKELIRIVGAVPSDTLALDELAARVTQRIADLTRSAKGEDLPLLALAHTNLAARLSKLGEYEGALASAQAAVDLYNVLVEDQPEEFLPQLAAALTNLSVCFGTLDRRQEALAAAHEAVDLCRTLVAAAADEFYPEFAASLHTLAKALSAVSRPEPALAAAQEAVELYRILAADQPEVFAPDLAMSLVGLANRLTQLRQRERALAATKEAVAIYRRVAAARPDSFIPDLAGSLNNLANRLSDLGDHEAALTAAQEAIGLQRALAAARPNTFNPGLARSLSSLASRLGTLGQHQAAIAAAQEAVELYRILVDERPDAYRAELALALKNLANRLTDPGQRQSAVAAAREAVNLYRALAAAQPAVFDQDFSVSLCVLGATLEATGAFAEAAGAHREAITTLLPIFLDVPPAFANQMFTFAHHYSRCLAAAGIEADHELLAPIFDEFQALGLIGEDDAD